jgi:hypothetical protein
LISSDIQYLREFVDMYIQSPNMAMTGAVAPSQTSKALLPQYRNPGGLRNGPALTSMPPSSKPNQLLEWLEESVFHCQQAFHQLCRDIAPGWASSDKRSEALSVKLCYNHTSTWRNFRPYRGVNVRWDSIVFLLQAQVESTTDRLLLVVDTPIIHPLEGRVVKDMRSVPRHLHYRMREGRVLKSIASNTAEIVAGSKENYVCLGSVEMKLSQPFRIAEGIVPVHRRKKGKQATKPRSEGGARGGKGYLISSGNGQFDALYKYSCDFN